jgi:2-polyprenyl-3-methyl-5-hydroxy-6-metoxy-1,4-benzoquinol methylase
LLLAPHRREEIQRPLALTVAGHSFDVVDDLCAYTRLPLERVEELVRRRHESFRSEWQSFPEPLRTDHWYYLASRTYLFANAIHLHGQETLLNQLLDQVPPGATALDFGGGTGNLSLALAATGRKTAYLELSAVQRDFVRFRTARHDLAEQLEVLDWWDPMPLGAFDVAFALDVLEHIPDLERRLRQELLPALRPGGLLVEASPFVRSLSNPMHHIEGAALDDALASARFTLESSSAGLRVWRRPGADDRQQHVTAQDAHVHGAERA